MVSSRVSHSKAESLLNKYVLFKQILRQGLLPEANASDSCTLGLLIMQPLLFDANSHVSASSKDY
eukprot:2507739-Amphidinium_carterae.1